MAFRTPASFVPEHLLSNVDPHLEQFWHPVATQAEPTAAPLKVELLGRPWVLVRLGGLISPLWDRCPYRLVPLSQGTVIDGNRLQCRYHGYEFDADGACLRIPAIGAEVPPSFIGVPGAHVREAFGLVWICPAQEAAPFPFDESLFTAPEYDGFITDGGPERSSEMHTLTVTAELGAPVPVHYDDEPRAPFAVQLAMTPLEGPGGIDYVWSFCQPIAPDRTRWYMVQSYSGLGHSATAIDEAREFQTRVGREDLGILEPMPVRRGPFWGRGEYRVSALLAMVLGALASLSCISTSIWTGPLASALGGADVSIPLGFAVAGLTYWLIEDGVRTDPNPFALNENRPDTLEVTA